MQSGAGSCFHFACMHRQARLRQRGSLSHRQHDLAIDCPCTGKSVIHAATCRSRSTSGSGFRNLSASFRMKSLSQRWQGLSDSQARCVAPLRGKCTPGLECMLAR